MDAAYGGYFALAENLDATAAAAFARIGEADSIVIDPHKHGLQPYGCGCILFRDPAVGRLYKHASPYTYFSSKNHLIAEVYLDLVRRVPYFTDVNDPMPTRVDKALRHLALVVADEPEVSAACTFPESIIDNVNGPAARRDGALAIVKPCSRPRGPLTYHSLRPARSYTTRLAFARGTTSPSALSALP